MTRAIRRFIARNRRSAPIRYLVSLARSVVKADENLDYDHELNGEAFVVRTVARHCRDRPLFLDVGANKGDWTLMALNHVPAARIHAFEIVPEVWARFADRVAGNPHVILNRAGLADQSGAVIVKVPRDRERSSIVFGYEDSMSDEKLEARVLRGDDYLREAGIGTVDLLKIDVEGGESRVLAGFSGAIAARRIRAIQFEYGFASIYARFLLNDFYELLTPHGYVLGKFYPREVDFQPYRPAMETFIGPNYLAVLESEAALIADLGGRARGG